MQPYQAAETHRKALDLFCNPRPTTTPPSSSTVTTSTPPHPLEAYLVGRPSPASATLYTCPLSWAPSGATTFPPTPWRPTPASLSRVSHHSTGFSYFPGFIFHSCPLQETLNQFCSFCSPRLAHSCLAVAHSLDAALGPVPGRERIQRWPTTPADGFVGLKPTALKVAKFPKEEEATLQISLLVSYASVRFGSMSRLLPCPAACVRRAICSPPSRAFSNSLG